MGSEIYKEAADWRFVLDDTWSGEQMRERHHALRSRPWDHRIPVIPANNHVREVGGIISTGAVAALHDSLMISDELSRASVSLGSKVVEVITSRMTLWGVAFLLSLLIFVVSLVSDGWAGTFLMMSIFSLFLFVAEWVKHKNSV